MSNQTLQAGGLVVRMSPWAFQHWAKDYYRAYEAHRDQTTTKKFSPARAFLLCRSIELGGKALYLAKRDRDFLRSPSPPSRLDPMKVGARKLLRKLGHDLMKACSPNHLAPYGVRATDAEKAELRRANGYYAKKGFEYFWAPIRGFTEESMHRSGPQLAASGYPELPDEGVLSSFTTRLLAVRIPT